MTSAAGAAVRFLRGLVCCAAATAWLSWPATAEAGRLFVVTRADHADPHVGCVLRYDDGRVVWLHFRPAERSWDKVAARPVPGVLDTRGFDAQVNHLVGFDVPDATLREAERTARSRFATGTDYELYERDCVAMAVTVSQACQLRVKPDHFSPKSLLVYLRKHNAFTDSALNLDHKKNARYVLPWKQATPVATGAQASRPRSG